MLWAPVSSPIPTPAPKGGDFPEVTHVGIKSRSRDPTQGLGAQSLGETVTCCLLGSFSSTISHDPCPIPGS